MCTTLVLFVCLTIVLVCVVVYHTQMVAPGSHKSQNEVIYKPFYWLLSYLPLRLELCERHVYCLWPLPRLLLVCTTLVCVLFVASTTSTISVYCLWLLPHLLLVFTTVVCVLFVATPMSTISVYYCSTCTVCGQYLV